MTDQDNRSASQETRRFTMHPDLLFSVIKAQAGTLSKAVLELTMNSDLKTVQATSTQLFRALDD